MAVTFWAFVDGELVQASDLTDDQAATKNLVGELSMGILGVPIGAAFLPAAGFFIPLTVLLNTPGSGSIQLGGSSQAVFVGGRFVDNCPVHAFAVPNNATGSLRTDVIGIQYAAPTSGAGVSRQIKAVDGTVSTGTVFQTIESLNYSYTAGSSTPPVGFTALALVDVPNSSNVPQNLRYQIPTVGTQMLSILAAGGGGSGVVLLNPGSVQTGPVKVDHIQVGAGSPIDLAGATGIITATKFFESLPGGYTSDALLDLQVGGSSMFNVFWNGAVSAAGVIMSTSNAIAFGVGAVIGGSTFVRTYLGQGVLQLTNAASTSAAAIQVGIGVPSGPATENGSLYIRTDGSTGSRWYVADGTAWHAVAGI